MREHPEPLAKERTLYTNILIPTDGSELAGKAVQHGIALAKRIDAKVTALTVLPPFHVLTTDIQMLEDTPDSYKTRTKVHPEKTLRAVADAAQAAGVACETVHVEHEHHTKRSSIPQGRKAVTLLSWPRTGATASARSFSAARPSRSCWLDLQSPSEALCRPLLQMLLYRLVQQIALLRASRRRLSIGCHKAAFITSQ
jgi:hypothetical protein